ncbi:MAG: redoxin domain-containing protein [Dehalococcoidia bacterium]|nr:redoxin domain-containing protein [Dehalococcoidia bacterium]
MTRETLHIRAPEFPPGATWLQGGPLSMTELRGRPVLIDFWDYTCINCIRTLPYLREWHNRYAPMGLTIVGVHSPEFSFARQRGNVARAVREMGIEYAVVLDNDYQIWQAYTNRYWPAKYLIDKDGYIRFYHFGEGAYAQTEENLQALLLEASPGLELPEVMAPVRPEDGPGAVCYRVTPELYLGYERGRIGNVTDLQADRPSRYRDAGRHVEGFAYLDGDWLLASESLERPPGSEGRSKLTMRYMAKEANLVMHPPPAPPGEVELLQDGNPLSEMAAGPDVQREGGRTFVVVDEPRMYELVKNDDIGAHELTLVTESDGIRLFAFTFVSCMAEAA